MHVYMKHALTESGIHAQTLKKNKLKVRVIQKSLVQSPFLKMRRFSQWQPQELLEWCKRNLGTSLVSREVDM